MVAAGALLLAAAWLWGACQAGQHQQHQQLGHSVKVSEHDSLPHHNKCQPITVSFCMDMDYNETIFPNILNQSKQDEVGQEVHHYYPLVKLNCSADLHLFLCSVFIPVCTILDSAIPPCRSLCLSAKAGCEGMLRTFSLDWPEKLSCDQYPDDDVLCVSRNKMSYAYNASSGGKARKARPEPFFPFEGGKDARDFGFVCPIQFQVPKSQEYSLRVGQTLARDCGAPCHGMFFSENERQFARVWVGTWAVLCALSCVFTVLTFLIDTERFRYPERPIIFLAVCYMMVAAAYVIGVMAGDKIACREPFALHKQAQVRAVSTISQGTKYEMCTILFMLLYFFSMASSIWWVVLTLTWFLAAGLKWGHEAIEANSQYFHLAAWAIPAIKTIAVLAMGKVEGDILSGVCYVGIWNSEALRGFVLIPLCVYLALGFVFLFAGFVSLFRIRTVMKHDGTKTDKLERLMMRIGVFSLLYTVPASAVLACLFYEQIYLDSWMVTWNAELCSKASYALPCPQGERSKQVGSKPEFEVFMVKYLMFMIVGITSSVWIWSTKTVHSWKVFFHKLRGRPSEAYV